MTSHTSGMERCTMDQSRGRERDGSILPVESAYHIDSRERLGVSEPLLPKPILLCDHVKSAVGTFRMNQTLHQTPPASFSTFSALRFVHIAFGCESFPADAPHTASDSLCCWAHATPRTFVAFVRRTCRRTSRHAFAGCKILTSVRRRH